MKDSTKKLKPNFDIIAQAPGRINIIGEHTDYNNGFVLPAAIDKKTIFRLRPNGTESIVKIRAINAKEDFSFDLKSFSPSGNSWQNYVMGVVNELLISGPSIQGFDGEFEGDVPIGSGMSSSAALECSLAVGLNALFKIGLDNIQLIQAAQMAEHNFVGIRCGIMDQFASIMGQKDRAILLDCRSLEHRYFPLALGNYRILLMNTNVTHSLSSSEYNVRRSECEEGVSLLSKELPKIKSLRDISLTNLENQKDLLPKKIFKRCRHVVSENHRVLEATKAIESGNLKLLGRLIYQSHFSLQMDYAVSCPELDFLVRETLHKSYAIGSRMMGGGFGGCTINLVEKSKADQFVDELSKSYKARFGIALSPYAVTLADGAGFM